MLIHSQVKEGEDINKVLKMPISYMLSILSENNDNKPKQTDSLISAFGG